MAKKECEEDILMGIELTPTAVSGMHLESGYSRVAPVKLRADEPSLKPFKLGPVRDLVFLVLAMHPLRHANVFC